MGNQLSTETLSSRDNSGHSYWVDFDWKSFAKGVRKKCYLGCLNGMGPRAGEKVVVKGYIEQTTSRKFWKADKQNARTANFYLETFKAENPNMDADIKINLPFLALMDTVSKMNNLFGVRSRSRSLNDNEWVGIEEYIPGQFKGFSVIDADTEHERAPWLETFSHFTYHQSNGTLVVCNFEGVHRGRTYHLTNPVVHSHRCKFGVQDKGTQGINEFFKSHRCNDVCRQWPKMLPLSPPPSFDDICFPNMKDDSDMNSSQEDIYLTSDELHLAQLLGPFDRRRLPTAPPGYSEG